MGVESLLSVAHDVLSTENEYYNIFIDGVEDQVFTLQTEQLNDVVQTISSLLAKAATRPLGIRLLNKHLDKCSAEVFTRTGNQWTSMVLKSCQNQQLDCAASYEALGKLALKSLQTPELTKTFATTHLAKVYESLINVSPDGVVAALQCVETCLRLYPSSSGPSKRSLDKFLTRFHDSLDGNVVLYTGKCLHLLQQVSGGEAQSSNHKTLWKNYQMQLVGSIHEVYDDMFANCADMWDEKRVTDTLPSMAKLELSPEPISKAAQMYVRCHNLLNYLITALKEPFPVEKPLMPRMILGVISRGLGVNCNTLHQNPISDNIALALLLPKIHVELLQLLDVAIVILRGHLLPCYNEILCLLMDIIKSTGINEHYDSSQKPFRDLRAKAYETISLWCKVHNAGSRSEVIAEHLVAEILNDITPKSNELTLQVTKATSKHTSKKMKRQLQKVQNDRSKIAQSSVKTGRTFKASQNDERNQLLCSAAVRCLQAVLISATSFIKPTKLKLLQTSLIQICGNIYELSMDAGSLYGSAQCRLEIFNALYVLITAPHHLSPPPAEILLAVLQQASNRDGNMKVRNHCAWILQNLEKLIHPQKESLVFPIDGREIRNTFIMMGQEKLLADGQHSFSANGINEEESEDECENDNQNGLQGSEEENETENHIQETPITNDESMSVDKDTDIVPQQPINNEEGINSNKNADNEETKMPEKDVELVESQPTAEKVVILQNNEEAKKASNGLGSPQTISDSDESYEIPLRAPVEISSADDSMPLKLRVEDSDVDEVEIISIEPLTKKPRTEEVAMPGDGDDNTVVVVSESTASEKTAKDTAAKQGEEEVLNTSADNIIMEMDEDALVEEIASQFVDDLA